MAARLPQILNFLKWIMSIFLMVTKMKSNCGSKIDFEIFRFLVLDETQYTHLNN